MRKWGEGGGGGGMGWGKKGMWWGAGTKGEIGDKVEEGRNG